MFNKEFERNRNPAASDRLEEATLTPKKGEELPTTHQPSGASGKSFSEPVQARDKHKLKIQPLALPQ